MKKNKIITINGDNKSWYQKAIFVQKNENNNIPENFVEEAEKIIDQYLLRSGFQNATKKNTPVMTRSRSRSRSKKIYKTSKIDMFLYYSIIFSCFTLMACYISLLL